MTRAKRRIRLSYQKNTSIGALQVLEESNYYPFGMKRSSYNYLGMNTTKYNYKYNGKELQNELGLNIYDYRAINYDPAPGRWGVIDPLAEKYRSHSTSADNSKPAASGVKTTGINLGTGFGAGATASTAEVFKLSKGIQNLKNWFNKK